jgi:hypothetical protein
LGVEDATHIAMYNTPDYVKQAAAHRPALPKRRQGFVG